MRHRKFQADYLFDGTLFLSEKNVLIVDEGGKIVDIVCSSEAGPDVEVFKGIISPGFVNAHCHLELSHLKNIIPEHTGLIDFVFNIVTQRHFSEADILEAISRGENEMMQTGIVAVGDICNNLMTLFQKKKKNFRYYNFVEISGWLPEIADNRMSKANSFYDSFIEAGLEASIVPHAPYSVSENLWDKMAEFFPEKTITIHNQENAEEDLFFLEGKGNFNQMYELMNIDSSFYNPPKRRSVENYFKRMSSAVSVILVHNTFTKQEDLNFINQQKNKDQLISFCLCPNANLYIENALPPVNLLIENNCSIILGTDSLASNHQLNILEEIKTIAANFPGVATESMLQWATINGARALQMEKEIGSFDKGKTPGVILIENVESGKITKDSRIKILNA
jgi:cytosine/adenosine deaminase-related metal-dependent hydrolase